MPNRKPFTWPQFEEATGRKLPAEAKRRIDTAIKGPSRHTWNRARTIVVAPQMSEAGQTLWQCAEAVDLTRYPDDGPPPSARIIIRALCYAAGLPHATKRAPAAPP